MRKFNITILHGIGSQSQGYSREFQKAIEAEIKDLTDKDFSINFNEIVYSDIIDAKVRAYTAREKGSGVNYDGTRELFNIYANDAIAFNIPSVKKRIIKRILDRDKDVAGSHKIYIAHSLGGNVLFNYLTAIKRDIGSIFTLGTPLALFLLYDTNLDKIRKIARSPLWLNIVGADDVIGKPIFDIDEVDFNYIAKIGGFFIRQTPLSHCDYFGDDDNVIRPIAKRVSMLIDNKFNMHDYKKYVRGLWNI